MWSTNSGLLIRAISGYLTNVWYWVLNYVSFNFFVLYHNVLKLIMFLKEITICYVYIYEISFNLMFLMPGNKPYPGGNKRKWTIFRSIKIECTIITGGWSLLKSNELCSINVLNFLSLFQISSFDSFGDMRLTKIGLLRKCWEFLLFG